MNITQGQFQILGFAILFCVVLVVLFGQAMNSIVGEKGVILKTEFVKNKGELTELVGTRTEAVKTALLVDTIGFIPIYFLLFTLIIWFLAQQPSQLSKYAAVASGIFAVATIFFDLSENLRIFDGFRENPMSDPINVASSAFGKWFCFFITTAILSNAFWKPHYLTIIIALLLLVSSTVGLTALFLAKYEMIEFSILPAILGLTICGIGFIFFSDKIRLIYE